MGILRKMRNFFRVWDTERFVNNLRFIVKNDLYATLEEMRFIIKSETIEDCAFELDELKAYLLPLAPKILGRTESLNLLENQPKSLARFGDGEIILMEGNGIRFQDYDPLLVEKMLKVLKTKRDDLYIGLNGKFFHTNLTTEASHRFYTVHASRYRRFFLKETNPEIQYLDACCFVYDEIIRDITRNVSKDTMICLILGPTATVMAADLTDMGYLAWDIGHIAKDYDIYMKRLPKTSRLQIDFAAPD